MCNVYLGGMGQRIPESIEAVVDLLTALALRQEVLKLDVVALVGRRCRGHLCPGALLPLPLGKLSAVHFRHDRHGRLDCPLPAGARLYLLLGAEVPDVLTERTGAGIGIAVLVPCLAHDFFQVQVRDRLKVAVGEWRKWCVQG